MANSTVEGGDVVIDDDVSIVDTWKGECFSTRMGISDTANSP